MASSITTTAAPNNFFRYHHHRHRHRHRITKVAATPRRSSIITTGARPLLVARAGGDSSAAEANPSPPLDDMKVSDRNVSSGKGYIGLFVRMLGLDNDLLDRDQAIETLWKYSQGGKDCIDEIMQFPGCINLVVSLLKSDSSTTCQAAAGLLRTVSSVNLYRDVISESGAIEEIVGILCRCRLTSEVKEQSLCTLWNLSIDEKLRVKLANSDFLSALVKFLDDEDIKVKEAAGGIVANLSLNSCNHRVMVEAGVIAKLADILKNNADGFKVIRKEAKCALLELSKDEYYRILIIEEGVVRVPLIGAAAYKSFRSQSHSWPSLPDGTELERNPHPSRYGASGLLLGLHVREKVNLEEAKMNAVVGRSRQQFLARIGAIEIDDGKVPLGQSSLNEEYTFLPWIDGVARLVLILRLEDVSAITRAAYSIADASISEHMRISFREAGAIKPLVQLLAHGSEAIQEAVVYALEKLCVSHDVCWTMITEGVLNPLFNIFKQTVTSRGLLEKTVSILSRILDLMTDMERKHDNQVVNGTAGVLSKSSEGIGGPMKTVNTFLPSDMIEWEKVVDSEVISCLVNMLRTSPTNLQTKVASVLEYISAFEPHATTITASDIGAALGSIFQQAPLDGVEGTSDNQLELELIQAEETGHAIASAARLLTKLLDSKHFSGRINSAHFALVLRKLLKSDISLHSKEWVAACLVKLESVVGPDAAGYGTEVMVYETIPRLVEQMETSFSYESRETAAIELYEVLSGGGVEYTKAVAASGGIFPLVKLVDEGRGDEALEASLAILYNLSMDAENHAAIIAAGAVPVLKKIVLSEGPQWIRALRLLRTLPT